MRLRVNLLSVFFCAAERSTLHRDLGPPFGNQGYAVILDAFTGGHINQCYAKKMLHLHSMELTLLQKKMLDYFLITLRSTSRISGMS